MKRRWIWIGIFGGVLAVVLFAGKVYFSSWREYQRGEEAFRKGDFHQALLHYERAIHWYFPGNSAGIKSVQRLWEFGQKFEEKGEKEAALEAYWTLRSSLFGVRSFYTPHAEWIERCNERIAALWLARDPYSAEEKKMTPAERKSHYLKLLEKDYAPKVGWAAVTEVGFYGWVICALVFIFTFLKREGGLARRKAFFWGGCTVFFYALWIIGLVRA